VNEEIKDIALQQYYGLPWGGHDHGSSITGEFVSLCDKLCSVWQQCTNTYF